MNARRYGRFSIPATWVDEARPEVTRVMGMCAIFRAEHMMMCDRVEYHAACWKFRPVPVGDIAPEYSWIFSEEGVECVELPL